MEEEKIIELLGQISPILCETCNCGNSRVIGIIENRLIIQCNGCGRLGVILQNPTIVKPKTETGHGSYLG